MKQRSPLISPVRLARAMLVGIVGSGVLTSGIALAAGFRPPPSPAPFNNVPELIWNAQESGFVPQDASFVITGSGVLGSLTASGAVKAAQLAAGGYDADPSGIAITAPSLYGEAIAAGGYAPDPLFAITAPSLFAGALETNDATVFGNLLVDPVAGSITLGGVARTDWPSGITGVIAGDNLTGGGVTGDVTVGLDPDPSINTLTVGTSALIPQISFNSGVLSRIRWNAPTNQLRFEGPNLFMNGVNTTAGSISTFSGPVNVTGGAPLYVQGQVTGSSLCALSGTACASAPHILGQTVSGTTICIGSDCRTSWPAGGGGGAGTVTSVGSGTGLTGGPITGAGTLTLDTTYTDGRYVNAAGDVLLSGDFRVNGGSFDAQRTTAGVAVAGRHTGSGIGVQGSSDSGLGVSGESNSNSGVFGTSSSGVGLRGLSSSNYGLLAQGSTGARILNGAASITTDVATGSDGINTNAKIVAPEYCIGGSCITSWPAGGGGGAGTVTSVGSGTGLTGGPITGAGTLTLDTTYTDGRYVNITGDSMTGTAGAGSALLRVTNTGAGHGIIADSVAASQSGLLGINAGGGYGVEGFSTSAGGIGVWGRGSQFGGRFTNATDVVFTALASDTVGLDTNRRIQSPEVCIAGVCRTSWGVMSLSAGTGVTLTPGPITDTGTIAIDTTYADGRYLNNSGIDTFNGTELFVVGNTVFEALDVNNNGSGRGMRVRNSGASPTILAQNGSSGNAGTFSNSTGASVELTRGSQAIFATSPVGSKSYIDELQVDTLQVGVVTNFGDWTTATRENVAISSGWNNAPTACPAGYKVTGISCFNWDAGRNYPGCTSKKGLAPDNNIQLYGTGFNVTYTLYCAKLP